MDFIALIALLIMWGIIGLVILKMFSASAMCDCQRENLLGTDHPKPFKRPEEKQRSESPTDEPGGTGRTQAADFYKNSQDSPPEGLG